MSGEVVPPATERRSSLGQVLSWHIAPISGISSRIWFWLSSPLAGSHSGTVNQNAFPSTHFLEWENYYKIQHSSQQFKLWAEWLWGWKWMVSDTKKAAPKRLSGGSCHLIPSSIKVCSSPIFIPVLWATPYPSNKLLLLNQPKSASLVCTKWH